MGNRILKESICTSESIDSLDWFDEVFFYRLIVNCDDFGRFDARPAILKARLFPLKDIRLSQIEHALQNCATAGMVMVYECGSKPFLQLCNWKAHQTIRNQKSKYPGPVEADVIPQSPSPDPDQSKLHAIEFNCNQSDAVAPVIQSESEYEYENNNPLPPSRGRTKAQAPSERDFFLRIDGLTENEELRSAMRDWVTMRRQADPKKFTIRALELSFEKAEKLFPGNPAKQAQSYLQSVESGWKGVFELRQAGGSQKASGNADRQKSAQPRYFTGTPQYIDPTEIEVTSDGRLR